MKTLKEKWKNKKFRIKVLASATALLLLFSAVFYTIFIKPDMSRDIYIYKEKNVEKGDLILGITETGNIAIEETSLEYTLELAESEESEEEEDEEGTIKYPEIEKIYVVKGQRINEGEALFKLTENSISAVEKELTARQSEAQIILSEAETKYKIQSLQAKSIYDTSMLLASQADLSYQTANTVAEEEVNLFGADIKVLEAEIVYYNKQLEEEELWDSLEEAETEYKAAKNIYEDTDIHNGTAYTSNYSDYVSAKKLLESIQDKIDDLMEGIEKNQKSIADKQQQMAEALGVIEIEKLADKNDYSSAVQEGELAEDIYNYSVSALEESVTAAENDLKEAAENLKKFKEFAGADGTIYSEGSGLVTDVLYKEGDELINTGAVVSYVKENAYTVSIDVSEEDISTIKIGDKVDIVMIAYPEQKFEGMVLSITTTAASDYSATISYPVTIKIEGDTKDLYGGMTAEVTFVTDSVENVLYISKKAIQTDMEKTYAYVKNAAGGKKLTEVETGFSNGANIEIISGLSEDDIVYIVTKGKGE